MPTSNENVRTPAASSIASDITNTQQTKQKKTQHRFVMNSFENEYVVRTVLLYNVQKAVGCHVDNICDRVAHNVGSQFVSDAVIGQKQHEYGITRRRSRRSTICKANVNNCVLSVPHFAKKVMVTSEVDEEDILKPDRKENGLADFARYMLDEEIMEYFDAQEIKVETSKKNTGRASEKVSLSPRSKRERI